MFIFVFGNMKLLLLLFLYNDKSNNVDYFLFIFYTKY